MWTVIVLTTTHFKVGVDVLGDNVLGFGFVLTVDDVHVKFAFGTLEQRTQITDILAAFFNGLQEHAVIVGNNVS